MSVPNLFELNETFTSRNVVAFSRLIEDFVIRLRDYVGSLSSEDIYALDNILCSTRSVGSTSTEQLRALYLDSILADLKGELPKAIDKAHNALC